MSLYNFIPTTLHTNASGYRWKQLSNFNTTNELLASHFLRLEAYSVAEDWRKLLLTDIFNAFVNCFENLHVSW